MHKNFTHIFLLLTIIFSSRSYCQSQILQLNDNEYLETAGLNVMLFNDTYPEGHQSGLTIIQNGVRVASNGDVRLEAAPGQWQPVPKVCAKQVNNELNIISVNCSYPDPDKNRKGFNPVIYPDLELEYEVSVKAEGKSIRVTVDLQKPIPKEWIDKIGFNLELFPGCYFGKSFQSDNQTGIFPKQYNGPLNEILASGKQMSIAPESDKFRMLIASKANELQLLDGRAKHNNGWFILRSPIPEGKTKKAIEWLISPNIIPDWKYTPVIHVSQVGYLPDQKKIAVIELDKSDNLKEKIQLIKINENGESEIILNKSAKEWGSFYRYKYYNFDFTSITQKGLYYITFNKQKSNIFQINNEVFNKYIWQPTLEYFLPVQMCHMRINDGYRVWHGLCHMDDALMAPTDTNHFDGYKQGTTTLTKFKPYDSVPGLNAGGWHDAGDYDLRVESQAGTIRMLSFAYEEFAIDYDETTIDQDNNLVEIHRPDGKPDILQQIEHGLLSVVNGYKNLGRLYRGIICSDLRQYVLLGDGSTMTDNIKYTGQNAALEADDRWVFTEENQWHQLSTAAALAASHRAMKNYNPKLANDALEIAKDILLKSNTEDRGKALQIDLLVELYLSTGDAEYKLKIVEMMPFDSSIIPFIGWSVGRIITEIENEDLRNSFKELIVITFEEQEKICKENPFGIPYTPRIWGAGWDIQRFGVGQYYLNKAFPNIVPDDYMFNALNFILGVHPGDNTSSFVSGVGAKSVEVAYGVNRADWSYIPGGVVSGTGLIRPDFFELKEWPYFWQQTEYVIGGGATHFMFLVLAANKSALSLK